MKYTNGMRVEHTTRYGLGTVVKVEHDRVRIQFDGELECRVMLLSAPNIIPSDAPPPKKMRKMRKTSRKTRTIPRNLINYIKLVGCIIQVETRSDVIDVVLDEYKSLTNCELQEKSKYLFIQENRPAIATEWRVLFKAPPDELQIDFTHEFLKRGGFWRINRRYFAFELLSSGYRLGINKAWSTTEQ